MLLLSDMTFVHGVWYFLYPEQYSGLSMEVSLSYIEYMVKKTSAYSSQTPI